MWFTTLTRGCLKNVYMLKEWKELSGKKMMVRKVKDVEEEDCSEVTERQVSVVSLTHLEDIKQQELQHLLDQFPDFFRQEVM